MDEADRRSSAAGAPRWYSLTTRSSPCGSTLISSIRPMLLPSRESTERPSRSSRLISVFAILRSRNAADHAIPEPDLPIEDRGLAHVDVRLDIDTGVTELVPGNAMRLAPSRSAKLFRQAPHPAMRARPEPTAKRHRAELDEGDLRRSAFAEFGHHAVDLADLGLLAIDHLLVEYVADHLHQTCPKISKGIDTIASTKPSAMTAITAVLAIRPLRL